MRVAERAFLDEFKEAWKYHHKLRPDQLGFADQVTTVKKVGFYHGGDPLYVLDGIPGIWHEQCLVSNGQRT